MTEIEALFDIAKDAEVAAMGYTAAAAMSKNPSVRSAFALLAKSSLEAQERTIELLRRLGGPV